MDDKHLEETHTCIREKQANMDMPSNGEDAEKQDPWVCGERVANDAGPARWLPAQANMTSDGSMLRQQKTASADSTRIVLRKGTSAPLQRSIQSHTVRDEDRDNEASRPHPILP